MSKRLGARSALDWTSCFAANAVKGRTRETERERGQKAQEKRRSDECAPSETSTRTTLEAGKSSKSCAVVRPLSANTLRSALDRVIHEQRRDDKVAVRIPGSNDDEDDGGSVDGIRSEASALADGSDEEGGVGVPLFSQLCCQ